MPFSAVLPPEKAFYIVSKSAGTLTLHAAAATSLPRAISRCAYVVGNPPFYGARNQSKEQKAELVGVFHGAKNSGNVDYVAGWYMKAAEYCADYPVRCAFVSTNSICQGEQVANVWKSVFDTGMRIDFAYGTFRWANEANDQAHVFVVIVGFSRQCGVQQLPLAGSDCANADLPVESLVSASVREQIERCAQDILDARAAHPTLVIADLYDPDKMPVDLSRAHEALDAAVEVAYGAAFNDDEEKMVAHLLERYAELAKE